MVLRAVGWAAVMVVAIACGSDDGPSADTDSGGGTSATGSEAGSSPTMSSLTTGPSGTGVDCPVGSPGCACTDGGACDPGLECIEDMCADLDCPVGSEGCSCTGGGGCNEGLECSGGICLAGGDDSTSTGAAETTGDIDLDGWTRRRSIAISNDSSVALDSFQVFVTLDHDEDMNADFSDLRFTDADGTGLPYWIEHSVNPAFAEIWVRVPEIPAEGEATIYVYYGNPMAESESNGAATFSFFDHFDDDLDGMTWTATGEATVASSRLTITTGSVYTNDFVFEPNQWVEMRTSWENLEGERTGLRIAESQGVAMGFASQDATLAPGGLWCSVCDGSGECSLFEQFGMGLDPALEGIVGLAMHDDGNAFTYNRNDPLTHDDPWVGSNFVVLGNPWGSDAGVMESFDTVIDWVLVREWAEVDPEASVGAEEEL